jgi:hypothetical protein
MNLRLTLELHLLSLPFLQLSSFSPEFAGGCVVALIQISAVVAALVVYRNQGAKTLGYHC